MTYKEILFSTKGPISILTLNSPKTINALSKRMIEEMIDALTKVSSDESVKVIIIKAAGKHFCAGHNLSEMVDAGVKEYKIIFDQCTKMMQLIHEIPQPVIAQVQGIATAAGCQLASWCDLVVADENARFSTPGVKIGLFCSTPMVAISRAIGRKMAMEMLLTGRDFPAKEAKELGLVNKVVPAEELAAATEELAKKICEASRFALSVGKQGFYAQIDQTDDKAFHFAKHTIVMNNMSEDSQNGIKAFLEKKSPIEWKDRQKIDCKVKKQEIGTQIRGYDMNKYIKLMITALIIITADQITKQIIISNLLLFESIPIIDGFFNLTYLRNPGGAFSLFASESVLFRKIIFKILPTIVILILCFFYKTIPDSCKFQTFGISLIISGAIANLIDRFYFGYVIDFLDFYIKDMHYPAFNIADSAISIGIIFFLIDILFDKRKD